MSASQSWQQRVDNPDDPATGRDDPRFSRTPPPPPEPEQPRPERIPLADNN